MNHDIVYILKNDIDDTELIYSVRSVVQNFPYNKIWFIGGVPEHIEPDEQIKYRQSGKNKWEKATNTIKKICRNNNITEDFWLFNDDFFIMQPIEELPPLIGGTIHKRVTDIKNRHTISAYSGKLERTENLLRAKELDTLDYALHMPMLINRKKALNTINAFPDCPMFRCLYGNYNKIGGMIVDDVKIYSQDIEPTGDEVMLSTTNESFKNGEVGKYIREQFPTACKYEKNER